MCVSCACGQPNDDHGDKRNITLNQLEEAAQAADISIEEVFENMESGTAAGESQPMKAGSQA